MFETHYAVGADNRFEPAGRLGRRSPAPRERTSPRVAGVSAQQWQAADRRLGLVLADAQNGAGERPQDASDCLVQVPPLDDTP